jgi:hypothetical protein
MTDGEVKIVVMDRGWVKVGRLSRHPELAFHWRLTDCRTVRRWGTQRGLAQLANEGPMAETVLDDLHDSTVPYRSVLDILDTKESLWVESLTRKEPTSARPRVTRGRN